MDGGAVDSWSRKMMTLIAYPSLTMHESPVLMMTPS